MKKILTFLFCLGAFIPAAHAENVPESERDALVKSCMGGESPQQDPQRAEYCNCMRDSTKDWSAEDFKQTADESAKAHDASQESPKLQEAAKACITKVLGPLPQ